MSQVEQLKSCGVPEEDHAKVEALLAAHPSLSFSELLALWAKWKDKIPMFWELFTDIWALLKGTAPTTPAPETPQPGSPFAG